QHRIKTRYEFFDELIAGLACFPVRMGQLVLGRGNNKWWVGNHQIKGFTSNRLQHISHRHRDAFTHVIRVHIDTWGIQQNVKYCKVQRALSDIGTRYVMDMSQQMQGLDTATGSDIGKRYVLVMG